MNLKAWLIPIGAVIIGLIAYDMFVKKLVIKDSFESDFDDDDDEL